MNQESDVLWVGLPKWPQLLVVGDQVTPDQAAEIILRTNSIPFHSNDDKWEAWLHQSIGFRKHEADGDFHAWHELLLRINQELALVECEYLHNCRIASCYFQGPHGWIDWDGNVGCYAFNIGKWPSPTDVFESWSNIAKAFPFLSLRAQLCDREQCEEGGRPVIEYVVAEGKVTACCPIERLEPKFSGVSASFDAAALQIALGDSRRERGCSEQQFLHALQLARSAGRRLMAEQP
jgi:hypothetical protein